MPLLACVTTAKELGAVVHRHVPKKLKLPLARLARDRLEKDWNDQTLRYWLGPSRHTPEHAERNRAAAKKWKRNHPDQVRETQGRWYAENAEFACASASRWSANNPERRGARWQERYANDPAFALRHATRNRIHAALNAAVGSPGKASPTLELLGCSAEEYRVYLEVLFEPGMSWENWAHDGWHVDHTVPIASFDLTTDDGQRAAFHYTNTRPMWAEENMAKGSLHEGVRHRHTRTNEAPQTTGPRGLVSQAA